MRRVPFTWSVGWESGQCISERITGAGACESGSDNLPLSSPRLHRAIAQDAERKQSPEEAQAKLPDDGRCLSDLGYESIALPLASVSERAAYLKNGGTLEKAAQMANHASTRTTQLYDRQREELSLDEVERIRM